jgi:hypothetical protein
MANPAGALVEVAVGDEAAAWRSVGFAVAEGGTCLVGQVRIRFTGDTGDAGDTGGDGDRVGGIAGWTLAGLPIEGGDVDGLTTSAGRPTGDVVGADTAAGAATRLHPNGVARIDHLVIVTPDLDRTTAAFEAIGLEARRTREAGRGRLQRFFRLGEVILEVVGPVERSGDGPTSTPRPPTWASGSARPRRPCSRAAASRPCGPSRACRCRSRSCPPTR